MIFLFSNCVLILIIFEIYNLIEKFWSFVILNSKKELLFIMNFTKLLSFILILFSIFSFIVFSIYKFLIFFFKEKMTNLMSKIIDLINVFLFLNRKLKVRTKIIHEHFLSIHISRRTRSGFT